VNENVPDEPQQTQVSTYPDQTFKISIHSTHIYFNLSEFDDDVSLRQLIGNSVMPYANLSVKEHLQEKKHFYMQS